MPRPPSTVRGASAPVSDDKIGEIVDAVIDAAPECVRKRVLLPAIDWALVPPHKVSLLVSSLDQARLPLPRWLAKPLLLAGHTLSSAARDALPGALAVLSRLNDAAGEPDEREALAASLEGLAYASDIDADTAVALVRRLLALSWDDEALRFALAQAHSAPQALRLAGGAFERHLADLPRLRIRMSGSSTTRVLADALHPAFGVEGWRTEISESSFGGVIGDLLSPPDDVDALVVLLDTDGLLATDWRREVQDVERIAAERVDMLGQALQVFSSQAAVPLLINTLPVPSRPTVGLLDRRHGAGLRRIVDSLNARILDAAAASARVIVVDADQALSGLAARDHVDPKLWYYGRIGYSHEATQCFARAFAEAWRIVQRGPVKVLAVDFDNTLWGGIYGDDGVDGLACGEDFPGNAFQALQQECLRLKAQGLLLVALSKNEAGALDAFEQHPGMVLKADDFAAHAVNWQPKADNLRRIAADLNLGLDSVLFLDDSPHEREAMRRLVPEVTVPEMPDDPAERPGWLRRLSATWPARLTAEDASRPAVYAARRAAQELQARAASFEDYLSALEQRLALSFVSERTVARTAQMHQRTNQFNLTTVRLGEADISALAADPTRGFALLGQVSDRFGDHGLVVAATVDIDGAEATIRTLLMSCRVIGREVERAFVGALVGELASRGVARVRGIYVPTAKNGMVRDFYQSCGFSPTGGEGSGTVWTFAIGDTEPPGSTYVTTSWER
ncbi:FkbH [Hyphomicrobium nitrativorans NL23]|uniref:FkbH n=2 Tax=Hyphomicrobium TaxID=81 RepID=V5SE42_9HYPH|nr:FkbH [Hyphomicrobium nitrativorans NL23]